MIGLGVAVAVLGDATSGIWLAFIGWFVLQAAGAEARYVEAPGMLRVRDMMVADPVTTSPDVTLEGFAEDALDGPRTAFPVIEDGRAVGLFPLRCMSEVPRDEWITRRVSDCMLTRDHVPTLSADDGIGAALAALEGTELQSALVLDGERLVGLLSAADIARALRIGAGAPA
jgi:CBS domain-containing protein